MYEGAAVSYRFPYSPSCLMFELICLQERPGFMLPFVILNMICIVVFAVLVAVASILLFISNFLVGFGILIVGGLFVGKQCTCMNTHTHAYIHSFKTRIHFSWDREWQPVWWKVFIKLICFAF